VASCQQVQKISDKSPAISGKPTTFVQLKNIILIMKCKFHVLIK